MPIQTGIIFPAGIDSFPILRDYQQSLDPEDYTLDASHYNKLVNFVAKVQPMMGGTSASSDGSLSGIGYSFVFTVRMTNLLINSIYNAYLAGKMPRTNLIPYQFVLADSSLDYPSLGPSNQALGIIKSSGNLNALLGSVNQATNKPLVTVALRRLGNINTSNFNLSRFLISSAATIGEKALIIQGLVIDSTLPNVELTPTGSSGMPSIWSNISDLELVCSVTGVV